MLKKRLNQLRIKLGRDTDGATAIEFSLLALPFMILVFGILELAIVFFTTTSLQHNLTTHTRDLRVGESASICGSIDDLRARVCNSLDVQNCQQKLGVNITRIGSSQFDAAALGQFRGNSFTVTLDASGNPTSDIDLASFNVLDNGIQGNEILIAKAVFQHDLILPGRLTGLATSGLGNTRALTVTQAIRTEPFPALSCP